MEGEHEKRKGWKGFSKHIVFEANGHLIYNYCLKINKVVEKKIESNFHLISLFLTL